MDLRERIDKARYALKAVANDLITFGLTEMEAVDYLVDNVLLSIPIGTYMEQDLEGLWHRALKVQSESMEIANHIIKNRRPRTIADL